MEGKRIIVTGATGLFAQPLALELAGQNEVFAVARFSDPAAKSKLAAAGCRIVVKDIADKSLDGVPPDVDYVFHAAAIMPAQSRQDPRYAFEVNVQATGRLMYHCRTAKGFLHSSSGSALDYQGQRPLREDDPYGVHVGTYSYTKIAAEAVVEFACRQWQIPTVMIRICSLYGPLGGAPTRRFDQVAAGETVVLNPDRPNNYNPMYESDYVEKAIKAIELASVPPLIVNFAGSETMSAEDYCAYAAELLGTTADIRFSDEAYWPLWADVTKMNALLGPTKVSVREGILRTLAARYPDRVKAGV